VKLRLLTRCILLASLALLIAFVGWRFVVSRTSSAFVKAHYTKREYRIPMRDGVRLFTQVYAPKDSSQPHPFLVMRTPFSVARHTGTKRIAVCWVPRSYSTRRDTSSSTKMFAVASNPKDNSLTCAHIVSNPATPKRTKAGTWQTPWIAS
jgi:predicted acyl esterase